MKIEMDDDDEAAPKYVLLPKMCLCNKTPGNGTWILKMYVHAAHARRQHLTFLRNFISFLIE